MLEVTCDTHKSRANRAGQQTCAPVLHVHHCLRPECFTPTNSSNSILQAAKTNNTQWMRVGGLPYLACEHHQSCSQGSICQALGHCQSTLQALAPPRVDARANTSTGKAQHCQVAQALSSTQQTIGARGQATACSSSSGMIKNAVAAQPVSVGRPPGRQRPKDTPHTYMHAQLLGMLVVLGGRLWILCCVSRTLALSRPATTPLFTRCSTSVTPSLLDTHLSPSAQTQTTGPCRQRHSPQQLTASACPRPIRHHPQQQHPPERPHSRWLH